MGEQGDGLLSMPILRFSLASRAGEVGGVVTVPPVRTVTAATVRQPDLFDKLDTSCKLHVQLG